MSAPVRRALALLVTLALAFAAHSPAASRSGAAAPPGWFRVLKLGPGTYALSEPKYWQQNVSYLIVGSSAAILFDTGPGLYSIRPVVRELTQLPVLVIPSHLHFDHVGRIQEFKRIALPDLPELRAETRGALFTETPSQYMLTGRYRFRVSRWLRDGEMLDLGERRITVLSTPGHTPDSVTLLDTERGVAFSGDLVNRAVTLCDVPGSDAAQTAISLERLMHLLPQGGVLHEAHAEAPITRSELQQLAAGTRQIASGQAHSRDVCLGGEPTRRFDVGAFPVLLPGSGGERLRPLSSATQTLDWEGTACK